MNPEINLLILFLLGIALIAVHFINVRKTYYRDYIDDKKIEPKTKFKIVIYTIIAGVALFYIDWAFFANLIVKLWCDAWTCS